VIDTVSTSSLTYSVKFNGMVDFNPDKVANIYPLVTGNINNIRADLGDYVEAGQVLGTVKSAEIANYNSALIQAETNVRQTKVVLDQQKQLFEGGLASKVDVHNAQINYEQAIAAKVAAEKILSINGNNKNGEFLIKAPVGGFVVQKNVTNGMAIRSDNSNPLFTISDLKDVWVLANVYEENISKVHEGDLVNVSTITYPDKIFKGKVDKVMNVLDPTNKVMKVRVVLPNPGYTLKPQMFATITLQNTTANKAVSVNSQALIFDHSQYYVIIYKSKKEVDIRAVEVISIDGDKAFIKSGLSPGEKVVGSQAILIYGSLNS
jgi:cobalt-zinc-cadmium efflux system membrane fusion protein